MSSSPEAISGVRLAGRTWAVGHHGFTLVELMVAMTVGLLLVAGVLTVYLNTSRTNNEMAKMNQQMENGRFALQLLREDLWHAGFWGEYSPSSLSPPAALVDPCVVWSRWNNPDYPDYLNYKTDMFLLPVQGYRDAVPAEGCIDNSKREPGTDVLVVRRASTCVSCPSGKVWNGIGCVAGSPVCEIDTAGKLYLQVSLCGRQTGSSYVFGTATDNPAIAYDRQQKDCATAAGKRKFLSHIYYVRNYAYEEGDGIPSLVRSEFEPDGPQPAQVLVDGIEGFVVEYGIDNKDKDGNLVDSAHPGDGSADTFTSTPASVADWGNVVAIKIYVLARNLDSTLGHTDAKTYHLGSVTLGPFNDAFKRHVYSTYVRLNNPAGRRDRP